MKEGGNYRKHSSRIQWEDTKCIVDKKVCEKECYPAFEELWIGNDEILVLAELEIYPSRRKVCRNEEEIELTAKEFDLLCLLVINKGYLLAVMYAVCGENCKRRIRAHCLCSSV